jgi:hypothetical protein
MAYLSFRRTWATENYRRGVDSEYLASRVLTSSFADGARTPFGPDERPSRPPAVTHGLIRYIVEQLCAPGGGGPPGIGPAPDPNATPEDLALLRSPNPTDFLPSFIQRLDDGVSAFCGWVATERAPRGATAARDRPLGACGGLSE